MIRPSIMGVNSVIIIGYKQGAIITQNECLDDIMDGDRFRVVLTVRSYLGVWDQEGIIEGFRTHISSNWYVVII